MEISILAMKFSEREVLTKNIHVHLLFKFFSGMIVNQSYWQRNGCFTADKGKEHPSVRGRPDQNVDFDFPLLPGFIAVKWMGYRKGQKENMAQVIFKNKNKNK